VFDGVSVLFKALGYFFGYGWGGRDDRGFGRNLEFDVGKLVG
jgi:hypothetical protein